ncbi:MAG: hypothetical protein OXF50_06700 [Caldilineaceae bacterium]|nr:hypothetical protein [Caldilineaceae bacterium]
MSISTSRSTLSMSPQPYTPLRSWRAPRQSHYSGSGATIIVCTDQSSATAMDGDVTSEADALLPTRAEERSRNQNSGTG